MTVSIITAYYNGRKYLDNYLKMIMRNVAKLSGAGGIGDRTSNSLEVIIVNDSPEDNLTLQDISELCSSILSDKCTFTIKNNSLIAGYDGAEAVIRIIANNKNVGIHASRVRGFKESSGDYVIFLDQDDLLGKDAVKTYMENVTGSPEVLVSNAALGHSGGYLKWYRSDYHTKLIGDIDCYINVGTQIISPGHTCINRNVIPVKWLTYICTDNGADDYFLWLLMLAQHTPFCYIDKVLYLHSDTGSNLSVDTTVTDRSTYEFCNYLEEIAYFPDEYVDRLRRMVSYKADFRTSNKFGKINTSLHNLDILTANVIYKLRTRTPLGFNR